MKKLISTITIVFLGVSLFVPAAHAYREKGNYFIGQTGVGRQNIKI